MTSQLSSTNANTLRLEARNLSKRRRLENINLSLEPGQLVAIVGGSGAGKSTLLKTLIGIETASSGQVYLNGAKLDAGLRSQIGYVPQDDIVHLDLTVKEALDAAAKLRLPEGSDVKAIVSETLERVAMTERKHHKITNLSGGQRKRVSIGIELLADPKLILLDEPTSGLDPALDREMMVLLKQLAAEGKAVALVTHATGNVNLCDRVLFLGRGGRCCYFGPPTECLEFFACNEFVDVYDKLATNDKIDHYAQTYKVSNHHRKYIDNYQQSIDDTVPRSPLPPPPAKSRLQQWQIICIRELTLLLRDRVNLAISLVTAPVGIGMLKLGLDKIQPFVRDWSNPHPNAAIQTILVMACACLWVGLSASLPQVVKETAIFTRERMVGLKIRPYLGAKIFVLGLLALAQAILISHTTTQCFTPPSEPLAYWEIGVSIVCLFTLIASICLGLCLSTLARNASQANSLLPLVLIPQIVFSGAMFELNGAARVVSYFTVSRWTISALGAIANINSLSFSPTGQYTFPFGSMYRNTWGNLFLSLGMLGLEAMLFTTIAVCVQRLKK